MRHPLCIHINVTLSNEVNNTNCLKSLPSNRTNHSISFFFSLITLKSHRNFLCFIYVKYCDVMYVQTESPLIVQTKKVIEIKRSHSKHDSETVMIFLVVS